MKHVPATAQTAVVHAYTLSTNDSEKCMAMWAVSQLMAIHDDRKDIMQEYANIWAEKLKPHNPLSSVER